MNRPGSCSAPGVSRGAGGLLRFHQRLVKAPGRPRAQDVRQHLQRRLVLVRPGRYVIGRRRRRRRPRPAATSPTARRPAPVPRSKWPPACAPDGGWRRNTLRPAPALWPRRTCPPRSRSHCPAGKTSCRTPAGSRSARARCRCGCRWSACRSCAIRRPPPRCACLNTPGGEFSLRSNSLRTTVISDSRSSFLMKLFTSRSASRSMANSRFSSVAARVSK